MRRVLADGALGERDAGAIHQHLQAAEFLERQRHCRLAVGFGGDIGPGESAAELLRQFFAEVGLQVGDHHFGAVLGGHARRRRAESGRATGHQEYAISDLHPRLSPLNSTIILP